MSIADQSDSHGSRQSPGLSVKPKEKPEFKLCFPKQQMIGRSDSRYSRVDGDFITPKFYSRQIYQDITIDGVIDKVNARIEQERKGPRDLYRYPILSSQSYGWWYDKSSASKDPRFNFHKKTSDHVLTNAIIQWEDRKLRGLC
ncbi:uncharacterized protein LOC130664151 [Microplitis mediator]|uniref:uncharacterized protein LOC130664151 n=1 Tax=Microplitis mediator TaxID=375433 RepID=UPI002554B02D|nr:uncharacterized protein LOC130664151 [Microplitis mediator]